MLTVATPRHSIRRALLTRLMLPLLVIMAVTGASGYGLARHFAQTVLDYWLYDSALSLANRIKWVNGRFLVDLPEGAREILEWDTVDRIYYEVVSDRGERLIGNASVPQMAGTRPPSPTPAYYDTLINGVPVRLLLVSRNLRDGRSLVIRVAETQHKRNSLAAQVLWISLVLSLGLTVASALVIWTILGRSLLSAEKAIREVRSAHALAPLTPIAPQEDLPSEVMPLVQEINDLIMDLSSAHRLNQRFIADAAHQLRTPLSTLQVQLEIALREQDPVRNKAALDDAVHALARMGRTVHQLLALARADQNDSATSSKKTIDLELLAREEVERRIDDALAAGVDLGYAGAGKPVPVQGIEELLREAVANLLDNALLYGAGGRHITVGVQASPPQIYVEDRGPGIPSRERDKVRQRFYRVPGTPGDGCGLGLAIVHEIMRRHSGRLVLSEGSTPGAGGLRASLKFRGDSAGIPEAPMEEEQPDINKTV